MQDGAMRFILKAVIGGAGIPMALLCCWLARRGGRKPKMAAMAVLAVLALCAVASYFEFGYLRFGRYLNPHDVFHYYIGAKYSPEVDYADLYRAVLVADMEGRALYKSPKIRNLDTHGYEDVAGVLAHAAQYKERFTPERWAEFKKDIQFFELAVPTSKWNQVLQDKGYNATPVWNAIARFLTRFAPTDSRLGMNALIAIDPILLGITFAIVTWAFGWQAMLFAVLFFGTNFMMAFVHIRGAFLRLDWIACLVIATCLLHKRYYKTAGVLMAYSAMARVFPAIFLFGLGVKFGFKLLGYARGFWKTRKWERIDDETKRYIGFFAMFAVASVVLVGMSIVADGDAHRWDSFAKKISVHNNDISTTRVGFKYIFLAPVESFGGKAAAFEAHQTLWRVMMAVFLLALVWPARRLEDYETIPFGFAPAFFLAAPTFYYYVMLVVPLLLFAPKLYSWPRAIGLASLFVFSSLAYVINLFIPLNFLSCLILSSMLLVFVCYLAGVAMWNRAVPAAVAACDVVRPSSVGAPGTSRRALGDKTWLIATGLVFAGCVIVWMAARAGKPHEAVAPPVQTDSKDVVLGFAGDVMLARNVAKAVKNNGGDYAYPFLQVAGYVRSCDLAMCNLECPVTDRGDRVSKSYMFRAEPSALAGLVSAGFDIVTLANNHVLDYGMVGLEDTIAHLHERRIPYVGLCGNDTPQEPVVLEAKGVKIGFLGYADPEYPFSYAKEYLKFPMRPAKGDRETIKADIARLRPTVDVVVVAMHWGIEYVQTVDTHQRELGHFLIDAGADIVAAHHPHVQQPPELYGRGLIIYSLGNFVFDQHTRPPTRESRLYRVYVGKKGFIRAEYLPLEILDQDWQPAPVSSSVVPVAAGN